MKRPANDIESNRTSVVGKSEVGFGKSIKICVQENSPEQDLKPRPLPLYLDFAVVPLSLSLYVSTLIHWQWPRQLSKSGGNRGFGQHLRPMTIPLPPQNIFSLNLVDNGGQALQKVEGDLPIHHSGAATIHWAMNQSHVNQTSLKCAPINFFSHACLQRPTIRSTA